MQFDFITLGSATRDILYHIKGGVVLPKFKKNGGRDSLAFTLGSKFEVDKAYFNYGGGANNTAVSLARLGFFAAPIIALGDDDFGKDIIHHLQNEKISTDLVQIIKKQSTGQSAIIVSEQDKRYVLFAYRAANSKLNFSAEKYKNLKTKWLYLNSLNITGWQKIVGDIIKYKHKNPKTKIYWNPGKWQIQTKREEIIKLLKLAEVLQINKEEAISLIKNPKTDINSIIEDIYKLGPKLVVITDGIRGVCCYDGKKLYQQDASNDKPVDTTGAGDSFGSAFAGGLVLFNNDIQKALKAGVANSGSVVSRFGAQNGLLNKISLLKNSNYSGIIKARR
ncbi:MAG: carbohydrate kinase family protein [bacterium]